MSVEEVYLELFIEQFSLDLLELDIGVSRRE